MEPGATAHMVMDDAVVLMSNKRDSGLVGIAGGKVMKSNSEGTFELQLSLG